MSFNFRQETIQSRFLVNQGGMVIFVILPTLADAISLEAS